MVVIGYLANRDRTFVKYIARSVHMTLQHSSISDWCYVGTADNPADLSSRHTLPDDLLQSCWFTGPAFLWNPLYGPLPHDPSLCQDALPEERPITIPVASLATSIIIKKNPSPLSPLLHKDSDFNKLIRITMIVLRWKTLIKSTPKNLITREIAIKCMVKAAQLDCFHPP